MTTGVAKVLLGVGRPNGADKGSGAGSAAPWPSESVWLDLQQVQKGHLLHTLGTKVTQAGGPVKAGAQEELGRSQELLVLRRKGRWEALLSQEVAISGRGRGRGHATVSSGAPAQKHHCTGGPSGAHPAFHRWGTRTGTAPGHPAGWQSQEPTPVRVVRPFSAPWARGVGCLQTAVSPGSRRHRSQIPQVGKPRE